MPHLVVEHMKFSAGCDNEMQLFIFKIMFRYLFLTTFESCFCLAVHQISDSSLSPTPWKWKLEECSRYCKYRKASVPLDSLSEVI